MTALSKLFSEINVCTDKDGQKTEKLATNYIFLCRKFHVVFKTSSNFAIMAQLSAIASHTIGSGAVFVCSN